MTKLIRVIDPLVARLEGYIDAAQCVFSKPQVSISLEVALFDVADKNVTDEDVVSHAYLGEFNPIEFRRESTTEEMALKVNAMMSITRQYFKPENRFAELIETDLRQGFWRHLVACFDYKNARVVELGYHVPYVNVGDGLTYILYAPDMSRCMLLVGNASD